MRIRIVRAVEVDGRRYKSPHAAAEAMAWDIKTDLFRKLIDTYQLQHPRPDGESLERVDAWRADWQAWVDAARERSNKAEARAYRRIKALLDKIFNA